MTQYQNGVAFERAVRKWYERQGYYVVRSAGSRGALDLLAFNVHHAIFIQCKKERKGRKYTEDLMSLRDIPDLVNSRKELWVKRLGGTICIYDVYGELLGETMLRDIK